MHSPAVSQSNQAFITAELPPLLRRNFSKDETILILGGGVNAMTSAVALALLGYNVRIVSRHFADFKDAKQKHPDTVSTYGCASVLTRSQNCEGKIGELIS